MRPRLAFLGTGWIGRMRLESLMRADVADAVAVADPIDTAAAEAAAACGAVVVPEASLFDGSLSLDGLVIATPSAMHAAQTQHALDAGLAVFCQKPLTRTASECEAVVACARRRDLLLGVDFSYRHVRGVQRMRELVQAGDIGDVFAADLVFHNAYGPDKAWYRSRERSGGGCVIDLGIHLLDLALWMLPGAGVAGVESRLYADGRLLRSGDDAGDAVEDYAEVRIDLETGAVVRIACSWNLHAGRDAVVDVAFRGTRGAVQLRNVDGSFYDFVAEHHSGRSARCLAEPPDDWGGRALVEWAERLSGGARFDAAADAYVTVARAVDAVYGR